MESATAVRSAGPVAQYHDEEEWLKARKPHMTPSDIAAIFGQHPYKTAAEVQEDKLSPLGSNGKAPTPAMLRGQVLEPVAALEYSQRTGRRIRRMPMMIHRERPLFAASLDRQILAGPDNPTAGLEIKVPGWRVFSEIRRKGLLPYMIFQGQLEAEVAGYDFTAFGVFNADAWRLLTFDLDRDPAFCSDMMDRAEAWWTRHIVNREPVEVAEAPENLPEVDGEVTFREDGPYTEAVALLLDARDIKKEAEEAYKQAQDELKAALGGFGVYEGAGARIYYRRQPGRSTKDWKALERARPVDPARMQEALLHALTELPGVEDADVLLLLQEIGDDIRLDLSDFEKAGNPYEELRPYRVAMAAD